MLATFCAVLAIIVFLLMEHSVAFWLIFAPLGIMFIFFIAKFLFGRGLGIGNFLTAILALVIMVVALVVVGLSDKCGHEEMVTKYVFTSENSTAYGHTRPYCRTCGEDFQYTVFDGELVDKSYLEAIEEHSDGSEIIPGEYYTVSATASVGYVGYGSNRVWLTCQVENEEHIVSFNVEFREEFEGAVKSVQDGDKITFRGRFYDEGCGFTDCELINN